MDEGVQQEKEAEDFDKFKRERDSKDEEKTRKNREKRERKKMNAKKGGNNQIGAPGTAGGGSEKSKAGQGISSTPVKPRNGLPVRRNDDDGDREDDTKGRENGGSSGKDKAEVDTPGLVIHDDDD
jgi:hypothetical protein